MTAQIQEQLKELKKKFRSLPAKQREELGVSLLKINLGVNHDKEVQKVKDFIGDFQLELKAGKLEKFIEYLHAEKDAQPDLVSTELLSRYNEDEVETMRDEIKPLSLRHKK